jgi:hypothetical protein
MRTLIIARILCTVTEETVIGGLFDFYRDMIVRGFSHCTLATKWAIPTHPNPFLLFMAV